MLVGSARRGVFTDLARGMHGMSKYCQTQIIAIAARILTIMVTKLMLQSCRCSYDNYNQ